MRRWNGTRRRVTEVMLLSTLPLRWTANRCKKEKGSSKKRKTGGLHVWDIENKQAVCRS